MEKKQEGFSQLAITLLNHYDGAYYVDINTGEYTALVSLKGLKKLNAPYTGGDEFVVILSGEDYKNRKKLLEKLMNESLENKKSRSGPVIAAGMSVYKPDSDKSFSRVFNRADKLMYKNKKELKYTFINRLSKDTDKIDVPITDERKRRLDALFGALCTISDGGYIYLNDLRHDFSRCSLSLVTDFGMPSEYMYQADKLWNEHIHPDDLKAYRVAVDKIFSQSDACMIPLEYRARKADGTYVLLSTRGFVLSDKDGDPEYFGGIIVPL